VALAVSERIHAAKETASDVWKRFRDARRSRRSRVHGKVFVLAWRVSSSRRVETWDEGVCVCSQDRRGQLMNQFLRTADHMGGANPVRNPALFPNHPTYRPAPYGIANERSLRACISEELHLNPAKHSERVHVVCISHPKSIRP